MVAAEKLPPSRTFLMLILVGICFAAYACGAQGQGLRLETAEEQADALVAKSIIEGENVDYRSLSPTPNKGGWYETSGGKMWLEPDRYEYHPGKDLVFGRCCRRWFTPIRWVAKGVRLALPPYPRIRNAIRSSNCNFYNQQCQPQVRTVAPAAPVVVSPSAPQVVYAPSVPQVVYTPPSRPAVPVQPPFYTPPRSVPATFPAQYPGSGFRWGKSLADTYAPSRTPIGFLVQ